MVSWNLRECFRYIGEAPSDSSSVAPPPSSSTGSQISQGAKNNSRVAGKPLFTKVFSISFMGLGYGLKSSGSKSEIQLTIFALAAILPAALLLI